MSAEDPEQREPSIDAVVYVVAEQPTDEVPILGVRAGSQIARLVVAGEFTEMLEGNYPPADAGFWLWRETGTKIYAGDSEWEGSVHWSGAWVRPSTAEAMMLAAGRMPWAEPHELTPIVVERDRLVGEVAELKARLEELEIDLAAEKSRHETCGLEPF